MAYKLYYAKDFTGGGTGALDAINTTGLQDESGAIVVVPGDKVYLYEYDADSSATESPPNVIAPDVGTGRWLLLDNFNNYVYDTIIEFTGGDATPSISNGVIFSVPSAVTITNFDDPPATGTKLIEIIAKADNVIIEHDATKIRLTGGYDAQMNTDDSMTFRYDGSTWIERSRSFI